MPLGLYDCDDAQAGFARLVIDATSFADLRDEFVLPAHGLYVSLGFTPVQAGRLMRRIVGR